MRKIRPPRSEFKFKSWKRFLLYSINAKITYWIYQNIGSLKKLSTPLKHLHLRIRCNFYSGIDDGYAELEEILAKHSLTLESLQLSFKWKINFDDDDEDYDEGVNLGKIRTSDIFPKLKILAMTVVNSYRGSVSDYPSPEMLDIFGLQEIFEVQI